MTSLRRWWLAAVLCLSVAPLYAQDKPKDKSDLPSPSDVTIETPDGVLLRATYYPSLKGREAVPIILLPDHVNADKSPGSRSDYRDLCLTLQAAGHAPLAVDWRGIGESTAYRNGMKIEVEKLRAQVLEAVTTIDMEAIKNWLMAKNNLGECNIDKLSVVAAGASTPVAINWAVRDWAWPILPGRGKQGQDVKALVLLSPVWNAAGYGIDQGVNLLAANRGVSVQIAVGGRGGSKLLKEAGKLNDRIKAARPEPKDQKPEDAIKNRTLIYFEYETQFQGVKLLGQQKKLLEEHIVKFEELRCVNQDYPWQQRQ
ncbi:MAG TPA: hypothetical protein VGE52_15505 [Pirellulales bacterium]